VERGAKPQGPGGTGLRTRLVVYIDGFCVYCRQAGRLLRALDWGQRVEVRSFRHDESYRRFGIAPEALEAAMHAVALGPGTFRVVSGFAAVRLLLRHLPLLWPLWPAAWLLERVGWGERAYRWVARHRWILPDPGHCREGACSRK